MGKKKKGGKKKGADVKKMERTLKKIEKVLKSHLHGIGMALMFEAGQIKGKVIYTAEELINTTPKEKLKKYLEKTLGMKVSRLYLTVNPRTMEITCEANLTFTVDTTVIDKYVSTKYDKCTGVVWLTGRVNVEELLDEKQLKQFNALKRYLNKLRKYEEYINTDWFITAVESIVQNKTIPKPKPVPKPPKTVETMMKRFGY